MEFIYWIIFIIGITLLVPIIHRYLTAKSNEDETAVYVVKMRNNMMKILKIFTIILTPLGVMAVIVFFSFLTSKDWENMCYTAMIAFGNITFLCGNSIKIIKLSF